MFRHSLLLSLVFMVATVGENETERVEARRLEAAGE